MTPRLPLLTRRRQLSIQASPGEGAEEIWDKRCRWLYDDSRVVPSSFDLFSMHITVFWALQRCQEGRKR